MKNHDTKKEKSKKYHWEEPETPLVKLPFNLTLDVHHRLKDLSEFDKHRLIALESAFHAEAIFWCLYQINEHGDFNSQNIDKDEMMIHLAFVCQTGMAFANKAADAVDKMDMARRNADAQGEEGSETGARFSEFKKYATLSRLVIDLKLKPEEVLLFARERGLGEIELTKFNQFVKEIKQSRKTKEALNVE